MKRTAALLALLAIAASPAPPLVQTPSGQLMGTRGDAIDAFLGIPYAAPPVGDRRWRAPAPAPPWPGQRDATRYGADCVQDSANNPLPPDHRTAQSEDCLFLNVWRPAGIRPGARLPVMVWIHGGAFIMGSGAMPDYAGTALARQGVIVVSINYRLGRFGTFAHPALLREQAGRPTANFGLLDQIAALRWVRDSIRAFGGDPRNVTIFGESAGASSVNFLLTSPLARGLFAKAISQSGGRSDTPEPIAAAAVAAERWATAKRAPTLAALRALPPEVVTDAPIRQPAFPVLDGRIVLARTDAAFRDGLAAPVPYLLGANDHEQSLLRWMPGAAEALLDRAGPATPALLRAYADPASTRDQQLARLWGEAAMVEPARWRAIQHARRGNPVWLYRFAYVPEALRNQLPGVGHADEIPFVFGIPNGTPRTRWTAADTAMFRRTSGYWVAFARTGDPNHADAPPWPRFTRSDDALLLLDARGGVPLHDFARARLDLVEQAFGPGAAAR